MTTRRELIATLGAVMMPYVVRAQDRMRRVAILMNVAASDTEGQAHLASFQNGLQSLGWTLGRTLQIEQRWASGRVEQYRQAANELVALDPDVVVAAGAAVLAVQRASPTVPIVFSQAIDPVGAGFVRSIARPGGNTTGFMQFEFSLAGKWLQILREIAPGVTRIGVLRESANPAGIGQWAALQVVAEPTGIELSPLPISSASEIEQAITAFAQEPRGGLIASVGGGTSVYRRTIIDTAARYRLPAIYPHRFMAADGGMIAYGIDLIEQYRNVAGYVDRILRGEKVGDLPVQRPTKYILTVNLKTAKALGISVPPTLLARADEVIE